MLLKRVSALRARRPDRALYWASTRTMPFARPHFDEILAIDFAQKHDYPARGEYTGPL